MSPRGYFTKEYINPYFTSERYIASEEHEHAITTMGNIDKKVGYLITYPAKIAKRVWVWILIQTGYLKDIDKTPYI
jgi:hypothetical protein